MKYALPALLMAAAAIAEVSCGLAGDRLTFRVKVSDVRRQSNSLIKGKRPDESVEITLPGKMLNPAVPLKLVDRTNADWSTPEHAAASVVSADTLANVPWMIENSAPAERAAATKLFSDPVAVNRTRDYYRNIGKVSITGWTDIRGFRVLFLQGLDEDGDASLLSVVLVNTPAGWKQTDALANDDAFEIVWAALHTSGVR